MRKFGIMNHLDIYVCLNAEDAVQKGHHYNNGLFKAVEIEKVVIVQDGTGSHRSTVDLVLIDEQGNKSVVMITGNLLKSIPC